MADLEINTIIPWKHGHYAKKTYSILDTRKNVLYSTKSLEAQGILQYLYHGLMILTSSTNSVPLDHSAAGLNY